MRNSKTEVLSLCTTTNHQEWCGEREGVSFGVRRLLLLFLCMDVVWFKGVDAVDGLDYKGGKCLP
jgi:hypothetical protein